MKASEEPIVVEVSLNVPIQRVWRTITEPEEMRQWYFKEIKDFRPEVGFETQFTVELENRSFEHLWQVVEIEHGRRIAYTWKYRNHPGDSLLAMRLTPIAEGTHFRLEHRTTQDFPDEIPEFERKSGLAGWKYFIQESLKSYLES